MARNASTPATPITSAPSAPQDPWDLATGPSYDPATFYTRASDAHGHSAMVHVKLSPNMHGMLRALVESKEIPDYRTTADIVRDAVVHRMRQIQDMLKDGSMGADLRAFVEMERKSAEINTIKLRHATWTALTEDLDEMLDKCIRQRDYDTAWELLDRNEDTADEMSKAYADKFNAVLRKYTDLLDQHSPRLPGFDHVPFRDDVISINRPTARAVARAMQR